VRIVGCIELYVVKDRLLRGATHCTRYGEKDARVMSRNWLIAWVWTDMGSIDWWSSPQSRYRIWAHIRIFGRITQRANAYTPSFATYVVSGAVCTGESGPERRRLLRQRQTQRQTKSLAHSEMFIWDAIRTDVQIVEAIRSITLALFFLVIAPILGLVAAYTHDSRYDELLDDW
jgi:hypothetical protein